MGEGRVGKTGNSSRLNTFYMVSWVMLMRV